MNALAVAAKGKGGLHAARRVRAIGAQYGVVSPRRMDRRLGHVLAIGDRFGFEATLPITVAAFERHPDLIGRYADLGIEFAVHGYYHVDHTALSAGEQVAQADRARARLEEAGIRASGFRAPYLRWNSDTLDAVRSSGFAYDSSQAMHWPVAPDLENDAYRRALTFYGSMPASTRPVLPWFDGELVRLPYCLPDDEAVVERLRLTDGARIADLWLEVFRATYERGDLLTLAVHPERIGACARGIRAVLDAARSSAPAVWTARLDDIARWWRERSATTIAVSDAGAGRHRIDVRGSDAAVVLVRSAQDAVGEPWTDGYRIVRDSAFELPTSWRPVVGVHPASPAAVAPFLREQGYIVEVTASADGLGTFVRRDRFEPDDRLELIGEIESGAGPLVRLGRWPDGAKSALALTGDVDALTIWDFACRFLGR